MELSAVSDNASMISIRRGGERGRTRVDWLDSRHTFSFNQYYDPAHMGFRSLRVINEDLVAPGKGFGTQGHRDMEIFSYVLEGGLEHRDSMGTGSVIHPGEIQFMRAGTGVTHSEYNASESEAVHFSGTTWNNAVTPKVLPLSLPSYRSRLFRFAPVVVDHWLVCALFSHV